MPSDCEAEKNTNVEYSPLWKWLAKTACLSTSQKSKHSPEMAGKKTIFRALQSGQVPRIPFLDSFRLAGNPE
jgi:hypothetical protein